MHFFGLHINILINLKIISASFGIGGGIDPIATTLASRLVDNYFFKIANVVNSDGFTPGPNRLWPRTLHFWGPRATLPMTTQY